MTEKDKKGIFKQWLETLQQESWQLELLISGLALFGVFGAKDYIDGLENAFDVQFLRGSALIGVNVFIFLLKGSWYIFLINLVIHIVLRGLWIGAIGLRYVSEDIDFDKLKFSEYFHKLYTRRYKSFDDYIEELERFCSVIFAYTFLLFFILISASLALLWPILIVGIIGEFPGGIFILIYFLLGLVVFVDFIALNPLKKVKDGWFSKFYGIIFRFYSTITLSFIFRPLLLNFLDNKFTRRLFLFSIPYGILIIILLPNIIGQSYSYYPASNISNLEKRAYSSNMIMPLYYDNLRDPDDHEISYLSLMNYRVDSDVLEFFIEHLRSDEHFFRNELGIPNINKVGVYTGFKKQAYEDKAIDSIKSKQVKERVSFLDDKKQNRSKHSDFVWDSLYEDLTSKQDNDIFQIYAQKMRSINQATNKLFEIYVDDSMVTEQLDVFFSEHENRGEKGWRCFLRVDSLRSGIHHFKMVRNIYDKETSVLSPFIIEIPFILH